MLLFLAVVFLATVFVVAPFFFAGAAAFFLVAVFAAVFFLAGAAPVRLTLEAEACFELFFAALAGDFLVAAVFLVVVAIVLSGISTLILLVDWSLTPTNRFRTDTNAPFCMPDA